MIIAAFSRPLLAPKICALRSGEGGRTDAHIYLHHSAVQTEKLPLVFAFIAEFPHAPGQQSKVSLQGYWGGTRMIQTAIVVYSPFSSSSSSSILCTVVWRSTWREVP